MKIIVIGAGLVGLPTAYFLLKKGHEVHILDRQDGPGLETSFANGGMLTPSQADPWNEPGIAGKLFSYLGKENSPILIRPSSLLTYFTWGIKFLLNSSKDRYNVNTLKNARLAYYNLQLLNELGKDMEFDWVQNGSMKIYRDEIELEKAIAISELLNELKIQYRVLDAAGVVRQEPALNEIEQEIKGGVYYPDDQSGDAYKFCVHLSDRVKELGGTFGFNTSVMGLSRKGTNITGVDTTCGELKADAYVLAAGSYSTVIARTVNLSLPIKPVKGYSITLEMDDWQKSPKIPLVDYSLHVALTPLGNRLRVAGTAEFNGFNNLVDMTRVNKMIRLVNDVYPSFVLPGAGQKVNEWSGLRPYSCDGVPQLGQTIYKNLYLNTGHGHLGWSMCAGSGKLVADMIDSGDTELDIAAYQIDRFN